MEERKKDHIELALKSQADKISRDNRFYYEPMLSAHPSGISKEYEFLGKKMKAPIWISSMTGGTKMAATINRNLATAAAKFGLGMGLGSCRIILDGNEYFEDFNLRPILGNDLPFFANLGIAQVEHLLEYKSTEKIDKMLDKLNADGLIIHVNPIQEWLQPEGDRLKKPPLETITELLDSVSYKLVIKEVGQGMGPASIKAILELPVNALEFAAWGGTNFAIVELLRSNQTSADSYSGLADLGHTPNDMINFINDFYNLNVNASRKQIIVSGGIKNFLDGYYYINKLKVPSIYGQASAFLKYAKESAESLETFIKYQVDGLNFAENYLKVK
jgi:isopentenyl-diphosphate Delta-isomerase